MKYDFVAFGDIVTDCFIKLKEAKVECNLDHENCMLCVKFGQKIPFESATEVPAVGNGPNAAVAAAKLGLQAAVATELGDDLNGKTCMNALKAAHVATEFVGVHKGQKTNYHYVLQYEAERTILIKHELFERFLPKFAEAPKWFYLTSLAEGTYELQRDIARYAKENAVKLAFQPGTFQIRSKLEDLKEVYAATEIFFCNKEEAQQILGTKESDMKKLLASVRGLGPKIAVVTDGQNGAYIMDDSGAYRAPMYPDPKPPVNRTGAGDATSSTTVAYIIKGLTPQEALLRGMINASAVVQGVGAQAGLLTDKEVEALYTKRLNDFQMTEI
ncbi:MAG: PfkB family carbohydrate kinase, partial [bacterium]|nr:PfkB family carbohydrate kinase [bacterium]